MSQASNSELISLFFDNEDKNFRNGLALLQGECNNVIPILVNGLHSVSEHKNDIEANINAYFQSNSSITPAITDFKRIALQWPIAFDHTSGITLEQLNKLTEFFTNPTNLGKIGSIVFDFDRTFTMVEGLPRLQPIKSIITALAYSPPISPKEFVACHMGGDARMIAMAEFINYMTKNNKKIFFLTNNTAPLRVPLLIPEVLTLAGITDQTNITILSAHSHNDQYGYTGTPPKYTIIDKVLNMCDNTIDNTELHTFANALETKCNLQIYREWKLQTAIAAATSGLARTTLTTTPTTGGYNKYSAKRKSSRKTKKNYKH